MADNTRTRKLADRVHEIVARLLESRVKDPRLGFVTVTDVRMTADLQHATVFYTVLGSDEDRASSAAALKSATGMIRTEVGRQTGVRLTPSIEFILDAVPENAAAIEEKLREAAERDAAVAALAANATYAGDANPYRSADDADADVEDEAGQEGADAS